MRPEKTLDLLRAGVLGDSLGTFGDGVLGQFTWQQQSDGSLNLARWNGRLWILRSQLGSLVGNSLEDIIDEGVHDAHWLGWDTGVWVHLLQDLVNVDTVGLLGLLSSLLAILALCYWLNGFFWALWSNLWCHFWLRNFK